MTLGHFESLIWSCAHLATNRAIDSGTLCVGALQADVWLTACHRLFGILVLRERDTSWWAVTAMPTIVPLLENYSSFNAGRDDCPFVNLFMSRVFLPECDCIETAVEPYRIHSLDCLNREYKYVIWSLKHKGRRHYFIMSRKENRRWLFQKT